MTERRRNSVAVAALGLVVALVIPVMPGRAVVNSRVDVRTVLVHGHDVDGADHAARQAGLMVVHRMDAIGVVVAVGPSDSFEELEADPLVTYLEDNPRPLEFLMETSLRSIRADQARATFKAAPSSPGPPVPYDGTGVGVAVIDTGVDATHPMFQRNGKSNVVRNLELACADRAPGISLTPPGQAPVAVGGAIDPCGAAGFQGSTTFVDTPAGDSDGPLGGHGTHVASTVAGQPVTTTDGRKLSGVAPGASIISLAVTMEAGYTWAGVAALNWVAENHAAPCGLGVSATACPPIKVVNNSWSYPGAYDPNTAVNKAARLVVSKGISIAWSAGNSGRNDPDGEEEATTHGSVHTPSEGVISVASYNENDYGGRDGFLSDFSSRGLRGEPRTYPDVAAPGDGISAACRPYLSICSTGADLRDPNYNTISGTSMAAPHVAGAAALILQENPRLSPAAVERLLEASAHEFRSQGPYEPDPAHPGGATSYDKGHGLIDVAAAMAMVIGKPPPSASPVRSGFQPGKPEGSASITIGHDWQGGPLGGANASGCGPTDTSLGECDHETVRVSVPSGGADLTVTITPTGTPVGVEILDPDGSMVGADYFVDVIGPKTISGRIFSPGIYTVSVFAEGGAATSYTGSLFLEDPSF